jgi:hypothetical protein
MEGELEREPEPNLMGLTKHSARFRCLVADHILFAAIVIICKCCRACDANLCAGDPVDALVTPSRYPYNVVRRLNEVS